MNEHHAEAPSPAPLCLIVSTPDGTQTVGILTPGTTYTLGRASTADIHIDDPLASERHVVVYGGDPPVIVDVGSEHGTRVGGVRLRPHVQAFNTCGRLRVI